MVETLVRTVGWAFSLLAVRDRCAADLHFATVNVDAGVGSPIYPGNGPLPRGGGRYVVGKPYEIAGRRYSPAEQPRYDEVGIASWYGRQFHRRQTSNGEWFDMDYFTAAHTTLPLPSYAKVTNLENGIELIVRLNDRGPFVGDRIIDLSRRAAQKLAFKEQGTAKVRVQYIGRAPLDDNGTHLAAMNRGLENGLGEGEIVIAESGKQALATASLAYEQFRIKGCRRGGTTSHARSNPPC